MQKVRDVLHTCVMGSTSGSPGPCMPQPSAVLASCGPFPGQKAGTSKGPMAPWWSSGSVFHSFRPSKRLVPSLLFHFLLPVNNLGRSSL